VIHKAIARKDADSWNGLGDERTMEMSSGSLGVRSRVPMLGLLRSCHVESRKTQWRVMIGINLSAMSRSSLGRLRNTERLDSHR
jgi:hypothetical protein